MRSKVYILKILALVLITGCADSPSKVSCAESMTISPSSEESITALQIEVPADINDFKIGNPVFIVARNVSDAKIEVIPDNDLKLFGLEGDSWVVLKNKADYSGAVKSISTKSGSDPGLRIYFAEPVIANQTEEIRICIFLQGSIDKKGSKSTVMAATEVTLHP